VINEQPEGFVKRLLAGKNKPLVKVKREVIDISEKRAHPDDVDAEIQRKIEEVSKLPKMDLE
jgi:hypothetical protein